MSSTFPKPSTARTWNVCRPNEIPVYLFGDAHTSNRPVSSLHSKVDPSSSDLNRNVAEREVVRFGGRDVIVVAGSELSNVMVT